VHNVPEFGDMAALFLIADTSYLEEIQWRTGRIFASPLNLPARRNQLRANHSTPPTN